MRFYKYILDPQNFSGEGLNKHFSLLLGFKLAYHLLGYLSGRSLKNDSVVQSKSNSGDLSTQKKSIIFYLGEEKQELPKRKLVKAKNGGCLRKITAKFFQIFCIAEQIFKKKLIEIYSSKIGYKHIIKQF